MSEPTIRIRTKVGVGKVFTLYFRNEWVTIMSGVGASQSTAAKTLPEASENHLAYCKTLKEKQDVQGGRSTTELLHRSILPQDDPGRVSDGNDLAGREGSYGNGGEGWESILPPNDSPSSDEESIQLESQNPELKEEKQNE